MSDRGSNAVRLTVFLPLLGERAGVRGNGAFENQVSDEPVTSVFHGNLFHFVAAGDVAVAGGALVTISIGSGALMTRVMGPVRVL